jgi:7-carboxy-7-deazaguanine synthase
MNLVEIRETLEIGQARLLILTGGEPLLHQDKSYFKAILGWYTRGWEYEIETEGTFKPNELVRSMIDSGLLRINCSPKLTSAGMGDLTKDYLESLPVILELPGSILKLVVSDEQSVLEALTLAEKVGANPSQVYLMPEGTTSTRQLELLPLIYDLAAKYGVNFTPRLHVLRWDNKKGV